MLVFDYFEILSGGVLKWEQQCRLMHMCTRKYLCVAQGGKVTLTSDHLDPKTVFRLHPVIRVSNFLIFV
jgi:inositol 1,4,5-triphosphate receptor type 1